MYHIPALLAPTIEGLSIKANGVYVDATFGGGGHSRAIMEHLGANGRLYGFDQDMDAYANRIDDPRFTFVHSNFRFLSNFMRYYGVDEVDGIVADLGVSFHHFDDASRGFSFRFDGELDMRMNCDSAISARSVIATYSEERLADVLFLFGELKSARRMAAAIVKARQTSDIVSASQLIEAVKPFIKPAQEKKELAQLFQALRIEVNDEIGALKSLLTQSLKDRIVKNFVRTGNIEGRIDKDFFGRINAPLVAVNNKVIVPDEAEIERNPRSRSAKLRIAEMKTDE